MRKNGAKVFFDEVCKAFTCIVIVVSLVNSVEKGYISDDYANVLMCLVWTAIAIGVLKMHYLFEKLPTIWMIGLQYLVAMGLVWGTVTIGGLFVPLHPDGYRDVWRSFTVFYFLGASVFYIQLRKDVERQNQLLAHIKQHKE